MHYTAAQSQLNIYRLYIVICLLRLLVLVKQHQRELSVSTKMETDERRFSETMIYGYVEARSRFQQYLEHTSGGVSIFVATCHRLIILTLMYYASFSI